jgi:hypothetical protein
MDWKKWGGLLVAVVIIGGGSWYAVDQKKTDTAATPQVTVSATPAQVEDLTYKGEDGKNALELLKAKYTVETKTYSFGEMVQSINGKAADDKHYWAFMVNGVASEVGADAYKTKSTDMIEWKYTAL